MVDYKEKIKKLLSLSKSPNEHEAQSALAKAQQLMAEHKISMAEVEDKEKRKAHEHSAGITYSTRLEKVYDMKLQVLFRAVRKYGCLQDWKAE